MKTLYFVRHAESEGNIGTLQQGPATPLSPKGLEQVAVIADRFKTIEIDKIISSPQIRARDTARAIARITGHDIEYSDLLVERKRPSITIGMDGESEEYKSIQESIWENVHNPDWRYSDEETFLDVKERALKTLSYVETFPEENILLVSHEHFMRVMLACIIFGADLTSQLYWRFFLTTEHSNTGITVFKQTVFKKESPRWKLITWNDHAHLG